MHKNEIPVVYLRLKNALYGTLQAELPFWKNITGKLKEWGFEMNPYDEGVTKKNIYGSQYTILWDVEYLQNTTWTPMLSMIL